MDGEFIQNRKIEQIVTELARRHKISHREFSSGWIHTFQKAGKTARLIGHRWSLNDSAASLIASDKVATYELLNAATIAAVPHTLILSKGDTMLRFPKEIPSDFLIKPLRGTAGKGIVRCVDVSTAIRIINRHGGNGWALSPYLEIKREIRVILLDDECLLSYEKTLPITKNSVRFFNLSKGAIGEDVSINEEKLELAIRAKNTLGLRLAAVDIALVGEKWRVLEINDGFIMEHYLRQSSENYEKTVKLYERVLLTSLS